MTAPEVSAVASSIDVPLFVRRGPSLRWNQRIMLETSQRATPSDAADLRESR
jgi:hypothetical protein